MESAEYVALVLVLTGIAFAVLHWGRVVTIVDTIVHRAAPMLPQRRASGPHPAG